VTERLEKDREIQKERLTMSRTSSRTGTDRPIMRRMDTPPVNSMPPTPSSPRHSISSASATSPKLPSSNPSVRANLSFASAAAKKEEQKEAAAGSVSSDSSEKKDESVSELAHKVAEVSV
jgi:translation initiation factor 4B